MRLRSTFLLLAALLGSPHLLATPGASIEGQVMQPGQYVLNGDARLFHMVGPAVVKADAYLVGAAWLHRPAREAQRKLKAGVLFDLAVLIQHARLSDQPQLAAFAEDLQVKVARLPVTGRRAHDLDPVTLELEQAANRFLADGDRLLYPARPTTVRISGALERECEVEFRPLRPADDYLHDCVRNAFADTDWLYVIQPDGRVQRLGIGLWNREQSAIPAPGATLLVPLEESLLRGVAEELNDDLAAFLATQPLPMDATSQ